MPSKISQSWERNLWFARCTTTCSKGCRLPLARVTKPQAILESTTIALHYSDIAPVVQLTESVIRRPSPVVHRLSSVVCRPSFVIRRLSFVVHTSSSFFDRSLDMRYRP